MVNEPKLIAIEGFDVSGFSVQTKNSEEFNPLTAKLPALWQQFMMSDLIDFQKKPTPIIYGVYSDYVSDASDFYRVTVGISPCFDERRPELDSVLVKGGNYLVFSGKGLMPAVVVAVWQSIWVYFAENQNYRRSFISDFELYRGVDEVDIYIGIVDL